MTKIKICGLKDLAMVQHAIALGADFIGMVFYPGSPRYVDLETARKIALMARAGGVSSVALVVSPSVALVEQIVAEVRPHYLQFHGDEELTWLSSLEPILADTKIIKVIKIADSDDVALIQQWNGAADLLLLDAKPTSADSLPGGNARRFDWSLLRGLDLSRSFLAGGLSAENVGSAIMSCEPYGVDVSSGVEESLGVKSGVKIRTFIDAVRRV